MVLKIMTLKISLSSGFISDSDLENDCCSEISTGRAHSSTLLTSVKVHTITVHKDGIGIINGNINYCTWNKISYIKRTADSDESDPEIIQTLLEDAIPLHSVTKSPFQSSSSYSSKWYGSKQGKAKVQKSCCLLLLGVVLLSFTTLVITTLYHVLNATSTTNHSLIPHLLPPTSDNETVVSEDVLEPCIFSRSDWLAQPPAGVLYNNTLPVKTVIVCHTATEGCFTTPDCVRDVRHIQQFYIESRKWPDIAYNFLIGGDGKVYEGRGWDKIGELIETNTNGSLVVAFIGTFFSQVPSREIMQAFNRLVNLGVKVGRIAVNYTLVSELQLTAVIAPDLRLVRNTFLAAIQGEIHNHLHLHLKS